MQNIDGTYPLGENLPTKPNLVTIERQETFPITPQASTGRKDPHSTSKFITRLKKIRNTSQYEVISVPVTVPMVPPPPDPFPKFDAEASKILQQFEDFLVGKAPSDYVKFLLRCYFKDSSRRQGEIGLFMEPLDDLYKMQEAYRSISMKALQVDGPSERQKKLDCAGNKIGRLVSWLEDIWRAGIDGPYGLCVAYNRNRLVWQREAKISR
ncbi:uncharacterized protein ARMOST_16935 [Armillaria ostoyae]|uniref:Uncharacterized protein n=1 Tax=Armillaria ostoyae TaxID=47428 RepID=A0A284RXL3_ARMOS|nr:uncharacterized protein ARMOST_16935 [Armillaria ostoyae]